MNPNRKFVLAALAQGVCWLPTNHSEPLGFVSMTDKNDIHMSAYGMLWLGAAQVRKDIAMGPMPEVMNGTYCLVGVIAPRVIMHDYGRKFFQEFYDLTVDDLRKIGADNTGSFELLRSIMDPTNSLCAVEGTDTKQ